MAMQEGKHGGIIKNHAEYDFTPLPALDYYNEDPVVHHGGIVNNNDTVYNGGQACSGSTKVGNTVYVPPINFVPDHGGVKQ